LITALFVAPSPFFALRRLVKVGVFFSMYAVTFVRARENQAKTVDYLKWVLRSAWIPVLYGLGHFLAHADLSWTAISNRDYREPSTFVHENPFAYFCIIVLLVIVIFWRYRPSIPSRGRLSLAILAMLVVAATVTTGARGAILGAFIAFLLAIRSSWKLKITAACVALVALSQVPTFANPVKAVGKVALGTQPTLAAAMLETAEEIHQDDLEHTDSLASRLLIWMTMVDNIGEHYLLGHGLNSAPGFYEGESGLFVNPHNDYIMLTFETGICGLVLYWSILIGIGILQVRHRTLFAPASLPGVLADAGLFLIFFVAVVSFTDNMFFDEYSTPLIWGILGTATGTVLPRSA
jgi:O-antigen ligase